jgi:hypothetical protein
MPGLSIASAENVASHFVKKMNFFLGAKDSTLSD